MTKSAKGIWERSRRYSKGNSDLVNAKGSSDGTPLHFVVAKNNTKMVELLLAEGAYVNAEDVYGATPLSYAMMGLDDDMQDLLRRHGATAPRI